jgi:outer membrane receptor protein involved in Fe transport
MRRPTGSPRLGAAVLATLLTVTVAACGAAAPPAADHEVPVAVATIAGSNLKRLTLTESAVARLAIQTSPVRRASDGSLAIPYGAVVYGPDGATWAYTNPEGRVYVREQIEIVQIVDDDEALLAAGPAEGTAVVTVGAAELWGTETGVGGGH